MKIIRISKSILFVAVFFISASSFSKSNNFSLLASTILSDSILHAERTALEIYKIKSNKKFTLPKNRLVRVYCFGQKGRSGLKRARITEIDADEITFTPTNKKFDEVTYSVSTLNYIEFTTGGTVMRGVIVNTIVICVVVTVTAAIILLSILTRTNPHLGGGNGDFLRLIFDDFHKHIRFYKSNGNQKWGIRTIEGAL